MKPKRPNKLSRAGRPSSKVPDAWLPAVRAMALDGTTLEKIRERLIECGVEATRDSIQRAMHGDDTTIDKIVKEHGDDSLRGIESPMFDDFVVIVDDFILEGRTPERVRAYLTVEGFSVTTEAVASYMTERRNKIEGTALEIEQRNHHVHTRTMRRRMAQIWNNLPPDQRYTARMYGAACVEYGQSLRYTMEILGKDKPDGEAYDAASAEIERKLGIVSQDEPVQDQPGQDEPTVDTSSEGT